MASSPVIDVRAAASERASAPRARIEDDRAMLRAAAELTRDLVQPRPAIYWRTCSPPPRWVTRRCVATTAASTAVAIGAGVVAMLALYRALLFIHEVSHVKHAALPHFRLGWNAVVACRC